MTEIGVQLPEIGVQLRPKPVFNFARNRCSTSSEKPVKLRRWSATQRTRWLNRTRGLLKRARVDEVITALRELCRGRTAGKIRTHLNYFLKNRHRFAYTTMVGLGLPRGSGAVESAIRRVINLRIKGASIYWLPESVDAILLLRSFYKSGRWNCLQRMAMTPVGVSA